MSDFTLEIFDTTNILEIETSTEDNTDNIEIAVTTMLIQVEIITVSLRVSCMLADISWLRQLFSKLYR
jgi:hypothetical protein